MNSLLLRFSQVPSGHCLPSPKAEAHPAHSLLWRIWRDVLSCLYSQQSCHPPKPSLVLTVLFPHTNFPLHYSHFIDGVHTEFNLKYGLHGWIFLSLKFMSSPKPVIYFVSLTVFYLPHPSSDFRPCAQITTITSSLPQNHIIVSGFFKFFMETFKDT